MNSMLKLRLSAALVLAAGLMGAGGTGAVEVLRIGTIVPKSSPWGAELQAWAKSVQDQSKGALELQILFNAQQGDEGAMIGKMKAGSLDGAFVTGVGLSKISKPILALQMPGLFTTWEKLDAARSGLRDDFEKGAKDAGFVIAGWTDIGRIRLFSKDSAVRTPADVKARKPYQNRDDACLPALLQEMGVVSPVSLNTPEVLPNLNTGAVDIVWAPALLAEQFQWSRKLTFIASEVSGVVVGGIVFPQKRLDALPQELRSALMDTARTTTAALTAKIRDEDESAFNRLKEKMTVVVYSAEERASWEVLHRQARLRLAKTPFSAELLSQLETFAK
jgi:TRAP-type C4-dicarboxylate transport system substrate-binding protein